MSIRDWPEGDRPAEHPTAIYRRDLIRAREDGSRSSSTVSARMAVVMRFYQWALQSGALICRVKIFDPRTITFRHRDQRGFEHQKTVISTSLHIPNKRQHPRPSLEGGLLPVNSEVRDKIIQLAERHCSVEFQLILTLGFATGMRLRSILDLKLGTLDQAMPGEVSGLRYLLIGPRHGVSTKFSVNGRVLIPLALLERLQAYRMSLRRLRRVAKAMSNDSELLFLNRFGKRYGRRNIDRSPSINMDMVRLRSIAAKERLDLRGFYFHCTRATFGTSIVISGMRTEGVSLEAILCRLTDLLMHKSETTSLLYIKYVEETNLIAEHEKSYSDWLFGLNSDD